MPLTAFGPIRSIGPTIFIRHRSDGGRFDFGGRCEADLKRTKELALQGSITLTVAGRWMSLLYKTVKGAKVPSQVDALCFYCASQGTPYRLANRRHPYFLNQLIATSAYNGNASLSGPSIVGAGSFPRSILIPGTDSSIRIGG